MRFITDRANIELQKVFRKRPAKQRAQMPTEVAIPYPRLGRPIVDVAQYQSATFNLLAGPPDFPSDSGETQQAYAMCDFTTNDTALLIWTATQGSGGFWSAVGCGGTAEVPVGVSCPNCLNNMGPGLMGVSMSGVTPWGGGSPVILEDQQGVADQFNLFTHYLPYPSELGCTWIKEWTYQGVDTHDLRLQVTVGPLITNLLISTFTFQSFDGTAVFSKAVSSPDCFDIGSLNYASQSPSFFPLVSFSGASVTLSSL